MILYAATIFVSAVLLFAVQPMIAKLILPWFGGAAAVWTTCIMFFQIALLLGYLYAHAVRRYSSPRVAWVLHLALLSVSALTLSVQWTGAGAAAEGDDLTWSVVWVLSTTVGLPFFVLSTTGPLVQAWQSTTHPAQSPYRLYALSNLGSLIALISYPLVVERWIGLGWQTNVWRIGFLMFAALLCWSGWQTLKHMHWKRLAPNEPAAASSLRSIRPGLIGLWLSLAMAPSITMLATTNLLSQEVSGSPFLWVLPLSLYLLSFIVCFERPFLYRRIIFLPLMLVSVFVAVFSFHVGVFAPLVFQVVALGMVCFASAMTCHGELERLKPSPSHLTLFYLLVATGGSLGGVFVAVVAPHWFDGFYEFHIGLLACVGLPLGVMLQQFLRQVPGFESPSQRVAADGASIRSAPMWIYAAGSLIAVTFVLCSWWYLADRSFHPGMVFRGRNQYGLVTVQDQDDYRILINGRIEHGGQFLDPQRALTPSGYYVEGSGAQVAIRAARESLASAGQPQALNIGVIGLGTGSLVTWTRPGDQICFYEINPLIEQVAQRYFTYLDRPSPRIELISGDGRVQLARQLNDGGSRQFDVLLVDAFTSDSIPVHLLTDECFDLYQQHLKTDGILAAHITNHFVDLRPVVYHLAKKRGWTPILIDRDSETERNSTRWVLMTSNAQFAASPAVVADQSVWPKDLPSIIWTDDHASLATLVQWGGEIQWERLFERRERKRTYKTANEVVSADR